MNFNAPEWLRAMNVRERLAQFSSSAQSPEVDQDLSRRRAAAWRSQTPFTREKYFQLRLELEGTKETSFLDALGASAECLRSCAAGWPEWLQDLEEIYREYDADSSASVQWRAALAASGGSEQEQSPAQQRSNQLLIIAAPFVARGIRDLRAGIEQVRRDHERLPFNPETGCDLFLEGLRSTLRGFLLRTLVLELNVARVTGRLAGDTGEERFDCFLRLVSETGNAIAIFEEYPVLARLLVTVVSQWVASSLELLQRLCRDWPAIQQYLEIPMMATISHVRLGAGDTHREGRSVAILHFDSGQKIVYKPHSLATNVHFNHLLGWLRERGQKTHFHELKILERNEYGWTEFLDSHGCESAEGLKLFYHRLGGLVALGYLLQATDLHSENLVAFGEHPVLVDLETLLHPRLPAQESLPATQVVWEAKEQSVLRTALLPERIWMSGESEGVDISGLGGNGEQLSPPVTIADREGTDEMRYVTQQIKLEASQNQPTYQGKKMAVEGFYPEVLAGFEEMYRLIWSLRDDLRASDSPLSLFCDDEIRVLLRPTKTYAQVLGNAFHPNVLRDGVDQDRALDRLWVGVERRPELLRTMAAEQDELRTGNIPVFFSKPRSRSLWTSTGQEIANFLPCTAFDTVMEGLDRFSESDLARQKWFIRGSLASMEQAPHPATNLGPNFFSGCAATRNQLLEGARRVLRRIEALAFHRNDRVAWMGLAPVAKDYWSIGTAGFDLYSGTAGIALFLGYAAEMLEEPQVRALAKSAIHTAIDQAEEAQMLSPKASFTIGMAGIGGLLYASALLGHLWSDVALLERAGSLIARFSSSLEADRTFDIIGGAAGYICGLLALQEVQPSIWQCRAEASRAAEHLLKHAQEVNGGLAWTTAPDSFAPLTGFSHGTSGIAVGFLRLFSKTGDNRYRDAAFRALQYENSQFDSGQKNWYDFRNLPGVDTNSQVTAVAWCHGAPGIGMARLYALQFTDDPGIQADLDAALETTWRRGWGNGHCLCHGDFGNMDLLLQADQLYPEVGWAMRARTIAAGILPSVEENSWLCGTPDGVETPEFMVGLAGIGYGLLRLADPALVPSVLALEAPRIEVRPNSETATVTSGVSV